MFFDMVPSAQIAICEFLNHIPQFSHFSNAVLIFFQFLAFFQLHSGLHRRKLINRLTSLFFQKTTIKYRLHNGDDCSIWMKNSQRIYMILFLSIHTLKYQHQASSDYFFYSIFPRIFYILVLLALNIHLFPIISSQAR